MLLIPKRKVSWTIGASGRLLHEKLPLRNRQGKAAHRNTEFECSVLLRNGKPLTGILPGQYPCDADYKDRHHGSSNCGHASSFNGRIEKIPLPTGEGFLIRSIQLFGFDPHHRISRSDTSPKDFASLKD